MMLGVLRSTMRMAAILVLAGSPVLASAADKAAGWRNWADRGERIVAAIGAVNPGQLDGACDGVTGTVIGQGFQFPYWGQQLIGVCRVYRSLFSHLKDNSTTRSAKKSECKELKQVRGNLAKATDVAEEPRALPVAQELVVLIEAMQDVYCT
ncbi:hypothetical protein ASD67_08020 [Sphingopyxis sp. Root1497]|uniref:hypothetical protein n=1 Tax=Sphingopyxis sp. Root1497 TaxID=1736474 RepID=UPI0006FBAF19|nr:hypothetical protein [Sphingopyxis sp. Root1497]KQZ64416.1 hypothetical protein ASD67_08020 [Sphingopyxis sp. Root1497]